MVKEMEHGEGPASVERSDGEIPCEGASMEISVSQQINGGDGELKTDMTEGEENEEYSLISSDGSRSDAAAAQGDCEGSDVGESRRRARDNEKVTESGEERVRERERERESEREREKERSRDRERERVRDVEPSSRAQGRRRRTYRLSGRPLWGDDMGGNGEEDQTVPGEDKSGNVRMRTERHEARRRSFTEADAREPADALARGRNFQEGGEGGQVQVTQRRRYSESDEPYRERETLLHAEERRLLLRNFYGTDSRLGQDLAERRVGEEDFRPESGGREGGERGGVLSMMRRGNSLSGRDRTMLGGIMLERRHRLSSERERERVDVAGEDSSYAEVPLGSERVDDRTAAQTRLPLQGNAGEGEASTMNVVDSHVVGLVQLIVEQRNSDDKDRSCDDGEVPVYEGHGKGDSPPLVIEGGLREGEVEGAGKAVALHDDGKASVGGTVQLNKAKLKRYREALAAAGAGPGKVKETLGGGEGQVNGWLNVFGMGSIHSNNGPPRDLKLEKNFLRSQGNAAGSSDVVGKKISEEERGERERDTGAERGGERERVDREGRKEGKGPLNVTTEFIEAVRVEEIHIPDGAVAPKFDYPGYRTNIGISNDSGMASSPSNFSYPPMFSNLLPTGGNAGKASGLPSRGGSSGDSIPKSTTSHGGIPLSGQRSPAGSRQARTQIPLFERLTNRRPSGDLPERSTPKLNLIPPTASTLHQAPSLQIQPLNSLTQSESQQSNSFQPGESRMASPTARNPLRSFANIGNSPKSKPLYAVDSAGGSREFEGSGMQVWNPLTAAKVEQYERFQAEKGGGIDTESSKQEYEDGRCAEAYAKEKEMGESLGLLRQHIEGMEAMLMLNFAEFSAFKQANREQFVGGTKVVGAGEVEADKKRQRRVEIGANGSDTDWSVEEHEEDGNLHGNRRSSVVPSNTGSLDDSRKSSNSPSVQENMEAVDACGNSSMLKEMRVSRSSSSKGSGESLGRTPTPGSIVSDLMIETVSDEPESNEVVYGRAVGEGVKWGPAVSAAKNLSAERGEGGERGGGGGGGGESGERGCSGVENMGSEGGGLQQGGRGESGGRRGEGGEKESGRAAGGRKQGGKSNWLPLKGRWKALSPLGRRTFLALDLDNNRSFVGREIGAVDFEVNRSTVTGTELQMKLEAVRQHVDKLRLLSESRVVRCLGAEVHPKCVYAMWEYCTAPSLEEQLRDCGPMPENTIAFCLRQVVHGIAQFHSHGISHGDLQGRAILISSNGEAKLVSPALPGVESRLDVRWTPPEVFRKEKRGLPADLWAIGCVAVEMAAGKGPWSECTSEEQIELYVAHSRAIPALPEEMSPSFQEFVALCFCREPSGRPSPHKLLKHPFLSKPLG